MVRALRITLAVGEGGWLRWLLVARYTPAVALHAVAVVVHHR